MQNSPDHFEGYLLKDVAEFEGWIAYAMPKIASVEKIALHSIIFPSSCNSTLETVLLVNVLLL